MNRNFEGCALCGSTWGNVWEEVEGDRMFFCCDLCLAQFRALLSRIESTMGWKGVDAVEIAGDRHGRTLTASSEGASARFAFAFNSEGSLLRFERVDGTPPSPRTGRPP